MSTSYHYLRGPLTSLRLEEGPAHDRLTVFEAGANAGTLTLSLGTGRLLALALADEQDDFHCPMRTHFGGAGVSCVVTENVRGLDPALTLVSDEGEVLTVAEIRAFGAKRQEAR